MVARKDIRAMRDEAMANIKKAQHEVVKAQADLRLVQDLCDHLGATVGSHMGERCRHCSDCGGHDI